MAPTHKTSAAVSELDNKSDQHIGGGSCYSPDNGAQTV